MAALHNSRTGAKWEGHFGTEDTEHAPLHSNFGVGGSYSKM